MSDEPIRLREWRAYGPVVEIRHTRDLSPVLSEEAAIRRAVNAYVRALSTPTAPPAIAPAGVVEALRGLLADAEKQFGYYPYAPDVPKDTPFWRTVRAALASISPRGEGVEPWRPISEAKPARGVHINVRSVTTYRWLAYKPDGARQMKKAGRWQMATGHGGWTNAELPENADFAVLSTDPRPAGDEQEGRT